jgi:hypothetical protein
VTTLDDPQRVSVFDPALKHYRSALVNGPPRDPDVAGQLAETRSYLLCAALEALARSAVRDAVVLRGSLTLETWFGSRARRAKDIDLVVRDASCPPDGAAATRLLTEIADAVATALAEADVHVPDGEIPVDRIWTYERAEGRRLAVPWTFAAPEGTGHPETIPGSVRDTIQIDVVFREALQDAPGLESLKSLGAVGAPRAAPDRGTAPALWFASRAESLAWKVLWLDTDFHPQGKDVYDAVLLAENAPLSLRLLERVYAAKRERWEHGTNTRFFDEAMVDWKGFEREYPALARVGSATRVRQLAEVLRFVE